MLWLLAAVTGLFGILAAGLAFQIRRLRTSQVHALKTLESELQKVQLEARRIESAELSARTEFQALLTSSNEAVLLLDSRQTIREANEPARALLKDSTGQPVGKTLLQATLSSELCDLATLALSGTPTSSREVRLPGPTGRTLIVSTAPVQQGSERPAECTVVAQDVTELRRLEAVRRDFVANVSHELRTPLASIRAMAETLQEGAISDAAVSTRFLDTIIAESDRLARISEDLLILSAAESGRSEVAEVDLSELLERLTERLRPQAESAQLNLSASIEPGLRVTGSPDQLQQVTLNLLDNAIKYTPAGGSVDVSAARSGSDVVVKVRDTGIGILSEHLPRLFERFYRVDKGRSRASGGTGLGLSIVKHIVESHGGSICVESEYNRGSTFMFTLPLASDPSVEP